MAKITQMTTDNAKVARMVLAHNVALEAADRDLQMNRNLRADEQYTEHFKKVYEALREATETGSPNA